jgi:dTDP-4-dehydrorhamnose 3,5-epimerase
MKILEQPFHGSYLIQSQRSRDERGIFLKTYQEKLWREAGLPPLVMAEEFWSSSARGVLRGMHFQLPPCHHEKFVTCTAGRVVDVLLDLRRAEPTFGQSWSVELSPDSGKSLLIARGIAHGFLSLEEGSAMLYKTSTVYSAVHDAGIRWDSFGFRWGTDAPILSTRDAHLPLLKDFVSPF